MGSAGYGRVCRLDLPVMAGLVGVWPSMAVSDRVWPVMTESCLSPVLTGYGWVLAGSARMAMLLDSEAPESSLVSLQLDSFLY
nr:hypothetical protein [Tanacetum cinerariifolium]